MKKPLLTFLLLISFAAFADTANVSWVAPTARENGDNLPSSEIDSYRIYLDRVKLVDIPADVETYTMTIVGEKVLNMSTVDTDGRESVFSPDIIINGKGLPGYPDVTVTVTIKVNAR